MLEPGEQLDRYVIERELGAGGMATVYCARHASLADRRVAIKILHPHLARQPHVVERFEAEARLQSRLQSPHILPVWDIVQWRGMPALIMDFVEGGSLADALDRGSPFPLAEVLELADQLLAGLQMAHEAGVVHRDLKPDNILLARTSGGDLRAMLSDFGIAKVMDSIAQGTMTGALMGTLAYMSPEQIEDASRVDARSDLYSLGVMLWELLSGRHPYEAHLRSNPELVLVVSRGDLGELPASLPKGVRDWMHGLTAREVSGRFATAQSARRALAEVRAALPAQAGLRTPTLVPAPRPGSLKSLVQADTLAPNLRGSTGDDAPPSAASMRAPSAAPIGPPPPVPLWSDARIGAPPPVADADRSSDPGVTVATEAVPGVPTQLLSAVAESSPTRLLASVDGRDTVSTKALAATPDDDEALPAEFATAVAGVGTETAIPSHDEITPTAAAPKDAGGRAEVATFLGDQTNHSIPLPEPSERGMQTDRPSRPARASAAVASEAEAYAPAPPSSAVPWIVGGLVLMGLMVVVVGSVLLVRAWRADPPTSGEGVVAETADGAGASRGVEEGSAVLPARVAGGDAPVGGALLAGPPGGGAAAAVVCPEGFALVPAGMFTMGSPATEIGHGNLEVQREVRISRAFCLQTTEVTQGQWRSLLRENPSRFPACGPDCPVENVSWLDAVRFANRRSEAEGLSPCYGADGTIPTPTSLLDCEGYRLPTQAEWEYAARAGTTGPTWAGPIVRTAEANAPVLGPIAVYRGNSDATWAGGVDCSRWEGRERLGATCGPQPVASREPNPWGLHDLLGNVAEWTNDWLGKELAPGADPLGPRAGGERVVRGGSWASWPDELRTAAVRGRDPHARDGQTGFRLARRVRDADE